MEELLKLVSKSTLNHNSGEKELVNKIDLFFRNTCLSKEEQTEMMGYLDWAYIAGGSSKDEESEGDK